MGFQWVPGPQSPWRKMERLFKTPAPSRARSWRRQKVAWLKRRIWEINELCPKPQVLSWHGHTFIPGCVPFDITVQLHWIRDVHDVNIWNCGKSIGLESARVIRKNSLWKCCAHYVSLLLWLLVPCRCPAPAFVQRFVPITCSDIGRLPRNYAQTGMVMQSPTSWVLLYYNTWTSVCIVPSPQYWFGGPYWFGIRGLRQSIPGLSHEARIQMDDFSASRTWMSCIFCAMLCVLWGSSPKRHASYWNHSAAPISLDNCLTFFSQQGCLCPDSFSCVSEHGSASPI